jgi:NAD(P)-dependent dehydrogenase (short-subunit alcohol dehydrogenase family)
VTDKDVILVTGSSTGFGQLTSVTLARRGHKVFASMRDVTGRNRQHAADLEELRQKENLQLRVIELDVTDDRSVNGAVEHMMRDAGRIDVVVNNAGLGLWALMETVTVEQAKQMFETNFFGVLRVNRAVLPQMRKQRSGLLVHMSSAGGRVVVPSIGMYSATKFALEAMAETLRYELSQFGIDSVTVEPGSYPTAVGANAADPADPARASDYGALAEIPSKLKHAMNAIDTNSQDVADCVIRLIEMDAGTRPARTLVGLEQIQPLNDVALQWQTAVLEMFGFGELMTLRRPGREVA